MRVNDTLAKHRIGSCTPMNTTTFCLQATGCTLGTPPRPIFLVSRATEKMCQLQGNYSRREFCNFCYSGLGDFFLGRFRHAW